MKLIKRLFILLFFVGICKSASACSAFVLKNGNAIFLGKNFDWTFGQGYLIKNLRNTKKVAYYTHSGIAASWVSTYGSITFNQNGKDMPYGGMNEKGLVVEMLWLNDTRFNITENQVYVNELEWIQFQLDNYQSVDEVVTNIENLKIYPVKAKIHYILADAFGKSVVIEYLDGKPRVYEKAPNACQAITNNSVAFSEKYIDDLQDIPKKNSNETYRYHQLEKQIKNLKQPDDFSENTAFAMLKNVSIPKGNFKTVWTIVYNIEGRSISFYTDGNKKKKQINLNNIDFTQTLSGYNLNQDTEIVLDNVLLPYSAEDNFGVMSASLAHLGFDAGLCKDMNAHQMAPQQGTESYFSENYFHFNIKIPLTETGKRLVFAVMDSEENFKKRLAVTGGYAMGSTVVGTFNSHIYGLQNGTYAMIALIDENRNSELDFDSDSNPLEKYATFSDYSPTSMQDLTFKNASGYFTKANAEQTVVWR